MTPNVICFGEVLWDVLPTSKQPGGAPMNVAAGLRNFGLDAQIISRVGSDELGQELIEFLLAKGFHPDMIQIGQTHLTGVAKANISNTNEVTYKIVQPVAWDYIHLDTSLLTAVRQSDVFVYGSLAARSPMTRETLLAVLEVAPRKVFDVNLRAPHYERTTVEELLYQADIVKLNEHELTELSSWYDSEMNLQAAMEQLGKRYGLSTVCVTLGKRGAALLMPTGFFQQAGFPVDVTDTIGSGDAFLAGLLYKILQGEPPQKILAFACATGAFIATQQGATPVFTEATITDTFLRDSPTRPSLFQPNNH